MQITAEYAGFRRHAGNCRRLGAALLGAGLLLSAATASGAEAENALLGKVVEALGGMDRLKAVKTIKTTANSINFGNMRTYSAGGPPAHLSDNEDVVLWQPLSRRFRVHARQKALVPYPDSFDFQEAYDGTHATRSGPKDYRPGKGPALEGVFLGARLKRLWLDHPQWLFVKATEITSAGVRSVKGREFPVLSLSALNDNWRVTVDPDSSLPYSVAVREVNGLRGNIQVENRFGDWREVSGIMMPFRLAHFTGGDLIRRESRSEILVDGEAGENAYQVGDTSALEPPGDSAVTWGWNMAHWFLGRAAMGRSSDTRQTTPVVLREIGEGIFQVTGTSHHNLVIVGPKSLAVVDAPFYPARSEVVLAKLGERWPGKPVRDLILTHHHADHVGGMRTYVEAGARLVVPAGSAGFFREILEQAGIGNPEIIAVREREPLPGFGRPVELVPVPNSHAFDMIVVYFRDQKLLFATDIYSPGRPGQPRDNPAELLQTLRFYGLGVEKLIGGHGSGPDDFSRFLGFAQ